MYFTFGFTIIHDEKPTQITVITDKIAHTKTEDLSATLTLTLKYKDWNYVPLNFSVTMKSKKGEADDTVFTGLVSTYITNPKISYSKDGKTNTADVAMNGAATEISREAFSQSASNPQGESDEKTATLVVTITFGWGDHFKVGAENVNPYVFYNQEGKTYEANHADANTALTAISGLKDVSYTVTISGTTNVSGK